MLRIAIKFLFLITVAGLWPQSSYAQTAPAGLQGKSVVATWVENRTQRNVGEERTETVGVPYSYRAYVSSAGRPFARLTVSNQRGASASAERVGAGTRAVADGTRSLQFRGNSLVATSTHGGGARRIQIEFDGGFSSCRANVILGKQPGAQKIIMTNLVSKRQMEILSASTSAATCSIQSGNVFGD